MFHKRFHTPGVGAVRENARATIRAVAAMAGVSPSTVSRALNSPGLVNERTRQRVVECAELVGYQPNRAARSLVLGRTSNVGLIVPDIANPFYAPFIKAVEAYFRPTGYAVFLADTDEDPRTEVRLAEAMAARADGVILCSPRMSGQRLRSIAERTTTVIAHRVSRTVPSIAMDWATGIDQAVTHVHALGHRRCAFLSGPRDSWANRQRRRLLRAGCERRGIELVELGPYEPMFTGGFRAADEVMAAGVTAVFAYNDLVALGVLARLHDRGVRVPDHLSLVGFDDIPMASMISPPLTTVAMPIDAVARAAAAMLHSALNSTPSPVPPAPATHLVIRSTTGPPPSPGLTGSANR